MRVLHRQSALQRPAAAGLRGERRPAHPGIASWQSPGSDSSSRHCYKPGGAGIAAPPLRQSSGPSSRPFRSHANAQIFHADRRDCPCLSGRCVDCKAGVADHGAGDSAQAGGSRARQAGAGGERLRVDRESPGELRLLRRQGPVGRCSGSLCTGCDARDCRARPLRRSGPYTDLPACPGGFRPTARSSTTCSCSR